MKKRTISAEKGQALVIILAILLGMTAMLGLGIDGGGLYFLHQDALNSTDAGAIAVAYAQCTNGDVQAAGLKAIKDNGFVPEEGGTEVRIENFRIEDGWEIWDVTVRAPKPAYFIQVVHPEPLWVEVTTVSGCLPEHIIVSNAMIVALSTVCGNAVDISVANGKVIGWIVSNDELKTGNNLEVVGGGFYLTSEQSNGTTWSNGTRQLEKEIEHEVIFIEADMRPGGLYYEQAKAAGLLHEYETINTSSSQAPIVLDGYYFQSEIKGDNYVVGPNGFTIFSDDAITLFGKNIVVKPYIVSPDGRGLVAMSTKKTNCGQTAIKISSSDVTWEGGFLAIEGNVALSMANSVMSGVGWILAQQVTVSGSNIYWEDNRGLDPLEPPIGAILDHK